MEINTILNNNTDLDNIIKEYWQNGFVVLQNFFSIDIIQQLNNQALTLYNSNIIDTFNMRTWFRKYPFGQEKLEKIEPIIDLSTATAFRSVAFNKDLNLIIGKILGKPAMLLKDRLIFKQPGNIGYGLHQDFDFTWEKLADPNDILSVYIAIDDANESNGALEFYPKSHKEKIEHFNSTINIAQYKKKGISPVVVNVKMGDIIVFHSLTSHRSGANLSENFRKVFYAIFVAFNSSLTYKTQLEIYLNRSKAKVPEKSKMMYFL